MNSNDTITSIFFSALVIGAVIALIAAVTYAAIVLVPAAIIVVVGVIIYQSHKHDPTRKEDVSREHTEQLYRAALSTTAPDEDIDVHLTYSWRGDLAESVKRQALAIGRDILATDTVNTAVIPPPPPIANSIEGGRYRDMLARIAANRNDPSIVREACHLVSDAIGEVINETPTIESDITIPIEACLDDLPGTVHRIILTFVSEDNSKPFRKLMERLDRNFADTHRTQPIYPRDYKGDDLLATYLKGTPLLGLFNIRVPFAIPEQTRYEHTHILGGTGSGKTTAIKRLIGKDLEDVANGSKTVIVIDSQTDLITELVNLDFPRDRVVYVDADDIEHPFALNLFAAGRERFGEYTPLQREQLRNATIELYEFVLASILDTTLTGQQQIIFRYSIRLLLEIPGATLHTLVDLLEEGGRDRYEAHIENLEDIPKRFFETQFDNNEFRRMRQAVLRRLYLILENSAFERMFRSPECRLDIFTEMQAGKLILINTSSATLQQQGLRTFGRFFLALIAQAASERAMVPQNQKTPTMVYVDEAFEYLDTNVSMILAQARKQNVGLVMAHQFLGQIRNQEVLRGIEANTSIKLAGSISASDASALSRQMNCDTRELQDQPTFTFMTYVRGMLNKAVPVMYPPGGLDAWGRRTDYNLLKEEQWEKYAANFDEPEEDDEPVDDEEIVEDHATDDELVDEHQFTGKPVEETKLTPVHEGDGFVAGEVTDVEFEVVERKPTTKPKDRGGEDAADW